MFVSSRDTYVRFRTALGARDLADALDAAKALPGYLSLLDALELTLLAAQVEAGKTFQECAARWLARVAVEQKLTLTQMLEAGQILQAAAKGDTTEAHRVSWGSAGGTLTGRLAGFGFAAPGFGASTGPQSRADRPAQSPWPIVLPASSIDITAPLPFRATTILFSGTRS
jgi:hypothetical protein